MKRIVLSAAFAILASWTVEAQVVEKPVRWTWIIESCDTWNCAAAALVLANGQNNTIVLPTGNDQQPWVILRRVEEGSISVPDTEPYSCEVFPNVAEAGNRFASMSSCHGPMMLTVPDGRSVVLSLRECSEEKKRRATH